MAHSTPRVVVGIGEALFDCFEDRTNMGGAPLNAALAAAAVGAPVGLSAQMVTRVGRDDLGDSIRHTLLDRGLDVSTVQRDPSAPTGRVLVEMIDGEPRYEIIENVAWDQLQWDETLESLARRAAGITFGTLAQRCETSRRTIQRFLEQATSALRLFDVNLRQSFYSGEVLRRSCELADAVKLNKEELSVVARHLQLDAADPAEALRTEFHLRAVILTHGSEGTELITAGGRTRGPVPQFPAEPGSDPVGAGDACGATCLIGLILDWSPERIVEAANLVGAYVASRQGATPSIDARELLGELVQ